MLGFLRRRSRHRVRTRGRSTLGQQKVELAGDQPVGVGAVEEEDAFTLDSAFKSSLALAAALVASPL